MQLIPDPWLHLRRHTSARIALGRAGGSLPSTEVVKFAMDHALARDAVWAELDETRLAAELALIKQPVVRVTTRAADRSTYLQRPDYGRQLSTAGEAALRAVSAGDGSVDVAMIVADGLSALAAQHQAAPLLRSLLPMLADAGLSTGPLVVARQARVAIQDPIGAMLGARCAVILIGERPGLGTPDSLGAYLVYQPGPKRTDADRNCVSNIRPQGLPPEAAAHTLFYLLTQSLRRKISGVRLKDDRDLSLPATPGQLSSGG